MANKQQMSFSLAFLAVAIILQLAGQATARRELLTADADVAGNLKVEATIVNELIGATERAKAKVPLLGNSQMVRACNKYYAGSLESLNKALGVLNGNAGQPNIADLKASINAALQAYDNCDSVFAQSTRPSPFITNNTNLKALIAKFLELTSN